MTHEFYFLFRVQIYIFIGIGVNVKYIYRKQVILFLKIKDVNIHRITLSYLQESFYSELM